MPFTAPVHILSIAGSHLLLAGIWIQGKKRESGGQKERKVTICFNLKTEGNRCLFLPRAKDENTSVIFFSMKHLTFVLLSEATVGRS